jgi:hypothetical protein
MRTTTTALAAGLLALTLSACAGQDDEPTGRASVTATTEATPATGESPGAQPTEQDEGVVVEVTIADGSVTPQGERVEVGVGEPVTLRVQSDEADEIHVHSDPEHSLDVEPGQEGVLTFAVERPGQVAVESHRLDATIVQLVVR